MVEAIFRSRIPVISAVGHETDFTIADFVADLRAATPSAAAELVVGKKDEFLSRIDFLRHGLMRHMEKGLHERRSALQQLRGESALADFPGRLQELAQRLDGGEFALARLFQQSLNRKLGRWNRAAQRFAAFDMGGLVKNRGLQVQNLRMQVGARFGERLQRRRETIGRAGLQAGRHEPGNHPGQGLFHHHRQRAAGGARRGRPGRRRQDPYPLCPRLGRGQSDQGVNHEERDARF